MKITVKNGIILDDEHPAVISAMQYAKSKNVDVRIFRATHPNGYENFLIVEGETPVYEATSLEAIAVHIDIMALINEK